jgi:predicted anti-sigma-YlaC factor YlaD
MKHLTDEELFRLLDGECSAEEKNTFEAHIHTCAACMALYKDLKAIDLQLQQLPIESPSLDFTEKLMDKLQVAPVLQRKSQRKTYLLMLAPFGVIFVLSMLLLAGYAAGWLTFGSGTETIPFHFKLPSVNLQPLLENSWLVYLFLLVNAVLALLLLDKAVVQPFFRKRFNRIME